MEAKTGLASKHPGFAPFGVQVVPRKRVHILFDSAADLLRFHQRARPVLDRTARDDLVAERFDLFSQRIHFGELCQEKLIGNARLLLKTAGREEVHVGEFVSAVLEVPRLDPALLSKSPKAVIDFSEA